MDDLRERLARACAMADPSVTRDYDGPTSGYGLHRSFVDAILAEITAAGYAVVPMDATEEMLECGGRTAFPVTLALGAKAPQSARYRASDIWQAMLAANPLTPSK